MNADPNLGANYLGSDRTGFVVWAPFREQVEVHVTTPRELYVSLEKDDLGYFHGIVDGVKTGSLYFFRLDGESEFPDPASRYQPQGVHGPSQVMQRFDEAKKWKGLLLSNYIIYELHVGTFTSEGTFDAVIERLDELKQLGITAIELMPVAQFPGSRNWGYDGVLLYAVQDSYGGPDGLKRLVNACHQRGIAVVLDVVYNHIGPEGNHLAKFGPYFTDRYHTPWGAAINFDGSDSDEVRRFFIENALYWVTEYQIDALRLDALHAILDISSYTFIEEMAAAVHERARQLDRNIYLIGESSANFARLVRSVEQGGYGLDAQWNDDFHHAVHVLLTGENTGYYQDFGELTQLVKAFREGFAYSGEYSPYRRHRHGNSSKDIPAERFVVFTQNHDQVGNRARSNRLSQIVSFEALKLAAGMVLFSPYIPLLFMGEEYGETAPFPYFVSHSEPGLIEAVRKGRREEFTAFQWQEEIPDPQDEVTFLSARLNHKLKGGGWHKVIYEYHREIIRLRKTVPALSNLSKDEMEVSAFEADKTLFIRRWHKDSEAVIIYNLNDSISMIDLELSVGRWRKLLDSAEEKWLGKGSTVASRIEANNRITLSVAPQSIVLFEKES
jgi:maltooligosyltrehalose trehalohydrolase